MNLSPRFTVSVATVLTVTLLSNISGAASASMNVIVDATELPRKLLTAEIELSSPNGIGHTNPAVVYPKWIPGAHGPNGPIQNLAGFEVYNSAGNALDWERDWTDVYRFFLNGARPGQRVTVKTTYICNQPSVVSRGVDSYGASNIGVINWNTVLVAPEGPASRDIQVNLKLVLPEGWRAGSALRQVSSSGDTVTFAPVSLEQLIDRPLICGVNYRKVELAKTDNATYYLHLVSDDYGDLPRTDSVYQPLSDLAKEGEAMFGGAHFAEYHMLLTLSDNIPSLGLEHRESSLNGVKSSELRDAKWENKRIPYLLPHEFAHAWCGKYRRPAGMYTENFMDNKDTDLLWVYEGMTQYLGYVLQVRCGFTPFDKYIDNLAGDMAGLIYQKGRKWRPLRDTEVSAYTLRGGSHSWGYLRRSQDYYREGAVFAFELDARLRNLTDGEKSLNDFCRTFFAPTDTTVSARPFTRAEIVNTLSGLAEFNWDSLIEVRVYKTQEKFDPSAASQLGYRLEYTSEKPERIKRWQKRYKWGSFYESIGMAVGSKGKVSRIVPGSPADKAGLYDGVEIVAVEGKKYSVKRLEDAIRNTATSGGIDLLTSKGDRFETVRVLYDGGLRFYTLVENKSKPNRLKEILEPLTGK